jgi:hypothetical protein
VDWASWGRCRLAHAPGAQPAAGRWNDVVSGRREALVATINAVLAKVPPFLLPVGA